MLRGGMTRDKPTAASLRLAHAKFGPIAVREGHPLSTGEGGFESL